MKSNLEWRAWGNVDPLYGVATIPDRSIDGSAPWTEEEFYRLGEVDWKSFYPWWEKYGVSREHCLEIGCGAGRITRQLAKFFKTVTGVDVSPGMIEYAREHLDRSIVTLQVVDGLHLPLADHAVTAVFSVHVFQHFASRRDAAQLLREVFRVMKPGATIMIHLPVIVWPWGRFAGLHRMLDGVTTSLTGMITAWQRLTYTLHLRRRPPMRVIWYESGWLRDAMSALGFSDIIVQLVFGDSPMTRQHCFLFARKPSASAEPD
jgi:SAM-dependent methyltransferase